MASRSTFRSAVSDVAWQRQLRDRYAADDFAEAVERLAALRDEYGEDNNAEAVLRLLREHDHAQA